MTEDEAVRLCLAAWNNVDSSHPVASGSVDEGTRRAWLRVRDALLSVPSEKPADEVLERARDWVVDHSGTMIGEGPATDFAFAFLSTYDDLMVERARRKAMEAALTTAAERFEYYQQIHRAKGSFDKAQENGRMAALCRAALEGRK